MSHSSRYLIQQQRARAFAAAWSVLTDLPPSALDPFEDEDYTVIHLARLVTGRAEPGNARDAEALRVYRLKLGA